MSPAVLGQIHDRLRLQPCDGPRRCPSPAPPTRVHRARSWMRNSPSTQSSSAIDVQAISAPVRRTRHLGGHWLGFRGAGAAVGIAEAARRGGDALLHGDARLDRLALAAGPRPGGFARGGIRNRRRCRRRTGARPALPRAPGGAGGPSERPWRRADWPRDRAPCGIDNWYRTRCSPSRGRCPCRAPPRGRLAVLIHRGEYHGVGIGLRRVDLGFRQPLCHDRSGFAGNGSGSVSVHKGFMLVLMMAW